MITMRRVTYLVANITAKIGHKQVDSTVDILQRLDEQEFDCGKNGSIHEGQIYDNNVLICAGAAPDHSGCHGDSGGPLVLQENKPDGPRFQVGIVSFGDPYCGTQTPESVESGGAYTRVTAKLEWIKNKLKP